MSEAPDEVPPRDAVSRASTGDRSAIEPLLERYLPDLRAYFASRGSQRVRDREEPEDLAQSVCREALEHVLDGRLRFRDEPSFRKWLYRAALLKALNRHRYWGLKDRAAEAPLDEAFAPSATTQTPSEVLIAREELFALEESLRALPERYREVIALYHLEGLTHTELAARLDIEPGNSRVLVARALAALARLTHD